MFSRTFVPFFALLLTLSPLLGCGQQQMVDTTRRIRQEVTRGNYGGALAVLHKSKKAGYKGQDRVVYWMQEGMLRFLAGNFKGAVASLQKAEKRSKELYTKSISKGIKAAFVSNVVKDYPGEDYENVLVNVFKALAYLEMSDLDGAMVEARKINEKLKLYNTRYKKKNVYNQDAFAHWLMGLLFEMDGSYDDARIAYTKAIEVYKNDFAAHYGVGVPHYLPEDAARAALLSSDQEALAKVREEFGANLGGSLDILKKNGEVVLFDLNGQGPMKSDFFITCLVRGPTQFRCDAEPGDEYFKKVRIDIPRNATVVKMAFPQLHTSPAQRFCGAGGRGHPGAKLRGPADQRHRGQDAPGQDAPHLAGRHHPRDHQDPRRQGRGRRHPRGRPRRHQEQGRGAAAGLAGREGHQRGHAGHRGGGQAGLDHAAGAHRRGPHHGAPRGA